MTLSRMLLRLLPWILILIGGAILWKNCRGNLPSSQPKIVVSHNTMLTKIEELGKLELVKYNFKDVVEYKKEYKWLPDSKSVLIVAGEAVGCMDLRKLADNDIVLSGDSLVTLYLPAPEICYSKVDHQKSKILLMENTYFQDAELVDEAYKYAEKNVARSANISGILAQTEVNAGKLLKPLLESISGRSVIIKKHTDKLRLPAAPKH